MRDSLAANDVVLVGAGHTNMHIVRMWRMHPIPHARLTIVSPFSRATYSGMLPGTLAGLYSADDMAIDLYRFTAGSGIRLIVAAASGVDAKNRRIHFEDRPPIRFDVASIGIGSVPAQRELWSGNDRVLSIKPMATFRDRLSTQLARWRADDASQQRPLRVVVVGAGAAGIEISLCLDQYLVGERIDADVAVLHSGSDVLSGYRDKTVRLARKELARRGIDVVSNKSVSGFADGQLLLANGDRYAADLVIWAATAATPPELANFEISKADDGFLAVDSTLQSIDKTPVFVVGDTATIVDNPVRKAGVYAVRQGPVLWENLQRFLSTPSRPLLRYEPQRDFLSLLATGDGRAIGQFRSFSFCNSWAWKWKDHIDRKFMRMYQDYRPMTGHASSVETSTVEKMRCRGCGGKVGANVLSAALRRLEIPPSNITRQGLEQPDDAALLNPNGPMLDVLSIDFFQAFLDDPYIVGRVAALNGLSDLWASGADPAGALAMITLPEGPPPQQAELLYQLLAGGLYELKAAGATLLGGHTTESAELTIGFTVLGRLGDREPLTKAGLKPGDVLVVTKALGTGTLLAGLMDAATRAESMDAMLANMLISNAAGCRVAIEFGLRTVTDVTGFGLAGHLLEMLDASHVNATIQLEAIPLLPGFAEVCHAGVRSTLDPANREVEQRMESNAGVRTAAGYHALFDPQTSGGLLIGVDAKRAKELVERLKESGYADAVVIGVATDEQTLPVLRVE
ncbi:MAG: selenide, water dikinase SelD [Planctomycetota bacterium]|nr:selenide, water dikinase SelD [Planctomycetota bacterium]